MKLYRYSPINDKSEMIRAAHHIHIQCNELCYKALGKYLPNSGNMGIFCHYDDEYHALTEIRKQITEASDNINQKYFRLHEPITFDQKNDIPQTSYTHLYIRKPDPYRHHVGDVDFYLSPDDYGDLKNRLLNGETIRNARIFPRNDLDMIELYHPDYDVLGYISTEVMTKKVHLKQSGV